MVQAKLINECLHAYGIHSSTLQPELVTPETSPVVEPMKGRKRTSVGFEKGKGIGGLVRGRKGGMGRGEGGCRVVCGMDCEELMCCG